MNEDFIPLEEYDGDIIRIDRLTISKRGLKLISPLFDVKQDHQYVQ